MRTPWHLWPVGLAFLALSALGVWDQAMLLGADTAYMDSLGLGPAERAYYAGYPLATALLWGFAIWAAVAAALLLLARRRLAWPASLVALAAQGALLAVTFLVMDRGAIFGLGSALFDVGLLVMVAVFAAYVRLVRPVLR
ncbi:hypothetical protein [Pseudoroseicyclus sp. CXY001]|uniref:hypothetical protein n=1 Tax=Pseudoroseicyclus sp. CXY001 TaxID=3242492 RepID=UPI003570C86B